MKRQWGIDRARLARRHRVFIGITEVAGIYTSLQQGLEELGVPTLRVDVAGNPRGYRASRTPNSQWQPRRLAGTTWSALGSALERASSAMSRPRSRPARIARLPLLALTQVLRGVYRIALLAIVILRYDVIVFTGGASLLRGRDLPLLDRMGKLIVVVFTGSDHRPPYLNGKMFRSLTTDEIIQESERICGFVRLAERHATAIVALSSSAQFHRRPFVHLLGLGVPFGWDEVQRPSNRRFFSGEGVRILHSPTDTISKGTPAVRAIVQSLRSEGLAVDYVELIDRPHSEILGALSECDFVIDELYSDTPLARFATEAAWFGKPAVTTGEYARVMAADVPESMIPPTSFAPPERAADMARRYVTDGEYRARSGAEVQQFVRDQWRPRAVADRFMRIVSGSIPAEWIYDPSQLTYVDGWGLTPEAWRASMQAVLERGGQKAIGLPDHFLSTILARLREPERADPTGSASHTPPHRRSDLQ